MAVYDIIPHIKYTSGILNKIPPPFYSFSSEAEYI